MKFQYLLLLVFGCTVKGSVTYSYEIYGGSPVNITDAPYMAMFNVKDIRPNCGASIVHKQFLVTAGHCCYFSSDSLSNVYVTVGTDHVDGGEDLQLEHMFIHPKFNVRTADYDICVIKLKKQLKWSDKVKPIEMADMHDFDSIKTGDLLPTIGFGLTETHHFSKILLGVKLPYIDRKTCEKVSRIKKFKITSRMICAGGVKGKAVCNGDSGGPLVYKGKLVGAVSWGWQCDAGKPDVFAFLPVMRDFVDYIINTK